MEREPDTGGNLEEKPFLEHLEDLRRMFLKILLAWGLASLIAFLFSSQILAVAQGPLFRMLKSLGRGEEVNFVLKSLGPTEVFLMSLKLSFLAGFIFALPLNLYFVGRFILPALKNGEKRCLVPAFTVGGGLFVFGVLFAYLAVLPLSLGFFWKFTERMGVQPTWTVRYYISLVGTLLLAFGLVFEIPVVIFFLAKLGLVDHATLRRKRPLVIVGVFVLAALLTPPDIFTQIMMAIPMLILYELCVFFSKFFSPEKRRT